MSGIKSRDWAYQLDGFCGYQWWASDDHHTCRGDAGHSEDHVCPCGAHRVLVAAGPYLDTPDRAVGVLGRALLYADGSVGRVLDEAMDAWRRAHPDVKPSAQTAREVLLVSPAAGRVLDAARRWRWADRQASGEHAFSDGNPFAGVRNGDDLTRMFEALDVLGAAVDALAGDQPDQRCPNCAPGYDCERGIYHPAEPAYVGEPAAERMHHRPEPDPEPGLDDLTDAERAAFVAAAEGREPTPEPDSGKEPDHA